MEDKQWKKLLALKWRKDAQAALEKLRASNNEGILVVRATQTSINMMMAKQGLPWRLRKKMRVGGESWTWRDGDLCRLYCLQKPG